MHEPDNFFPPSPIQVVVSIFNGLWECITEALKQHTLQELDRGTGGKSYT